MLDRTEDRRRPSTGAMPRYIPLGSRWERRRIDLVAVAWLVSAVVFWRWWLEADHVVTLPGTIINSAIIAFEFLVLPLWFIVFVRRARRPDRRGSLPDLRTAMVVTKAPSEPWTVVQRTLEAMLAQAADVAYDVWLADEAPTEDVRRWCAEHGVQISSRHGVADYHRATWPRRTRCKEGNLAYFYDHYGYDGYDVVCQFDADHVPEPAYLGWVLKAFGDPDVGYVAAPSICDANAAGSWAARGRLYLEAALHGVAQAGANEGWAPCCIGSHYAVRTDALREIGGLGPELAEDFSTSLMLQAAGWRGAFAIDAIARGDGPATVTDAVTQDLQWSQSMMSLLLDHAWSELPRAEPKARFKLAFCLSWYPLGGLTLVAAHAIPVVALLTGRPIVSVALGSFLLHLLPCMLTMIALVWAARRAGWLRPVDAPVISWEAALFALVRWPWTVLGCARAIWVKITGRSVEWRVTPKGGGLAVLLPPVILAPPLLIAAVSAGAVILAPDPGAASGYLFWALFNAVLYLFVAGTLLVLHASEQVAGVRSGFRRVRLVARPAVAALGASCIVGPGVAVGGGSAWRILSPVPVIAADSAPSPVARQLGVRGIALGVTTPATAEDASTPIVADDLIGVDRFERTVRAHADIVQLFTDFAADPAPLRREFATIDRRGSVPQLTWEPWDHRVGLRKNQPFYALRTIIAGRHDAYIRAVARQIRAFGKPVRLRFAQEVDNPSYPWNVGRSGNRPGEYVAAWRHVRRLLHDEGATNAQMIWSPLASTFDVSTFPGAGQVDIIGMTGFNGGSKLRWSGWRSFAHIFEPALAKAHALAPNLPVEISEVSSVEQGGDKAEWIRGMWRTLRRHPEVEAVIWFDVPKEADWRVDTSAAARGAFADGLAASRSIFPIAMPKQPQRPHVEPAVSSASASRVDPR